MKIVMTNLFISLSVIMIAVNIYKGKKANEGGRPMGEHFNGRFKW